MNNFGLILSVALIVLSQRGVEAQIEIRIPIDEPFRNEDVKRENEEREEKARQRILARYPSSDYFVGFSRTIHAREGVGYTIRIWSMALGWNPIDNPAALTGEVGKKVNEDYERVKEEGKKQGILGFVWLRLGALPPDPQDFLRHGSDVQRVFEGGQEEALGAVGLPGLGAFGAPSTRLSLAELRPRRAPLRFTRQRSG